MNYYHGNMKAYFVDKAHIFLHQTPEDTFVLGGQAAPFIKEYGYEKKIAAHTVIADNKNLPKQWKLQLPGEHNRYNAGLAIAAAAALGVDTGVICKAITSFRGVEGRLQFLSEKNGVKIYNDNNATTPEATVAALRTLGDSAKKNIILIMGGADKGLDMNELIKEISTYCKQILLLAGTGTERIKKEIPAASDLIYKVTSQAIQDAMAASQKGDIIIFSPAFASFGMFKNEYDRDDQFVKAVSEL
jgi:UDP-N-acetylmuramoylalanine--D-glutamate ligase